MEKTVGVLAGMAKQLPAAVLVFLAFTTGNYQFAGKLERGFELQEKALQQMSATVERFTLQTEKLTREVVEVHAHLDAQKG